MITRILIDNYRGFVNFELLCGRLVLLLGGNGSGKTSLLDALHSLVMVVAEGKVEGFFDAETRFRFSDSTEQRFELDVQLDGLQFRYCLELAFPGREQQPVVIREKLTQNGSLLLLFEDGVARLNDDAAGFPLDAHKGGLAFIGDRAESPDIATFKNWADEFLLLKLVPSTVGSEARKPSHSLFTDGSNFAAWYETEAYADTETLLEFTRVIRDVIPGLQTINLSPLARSGKLFEAVFQSNGRRETFALDELSDGQISLIVHYAILFFCARRGMTVALDEPDNNLALAEIEPLLYALEDATERNRAQVFVISHHPEIYNRWARDPERCRYFRRTGDGRFEVTSVDWEEHPDLAPAEVVARGWQDG